MPKYADVDLSDVEEALHAIVASTALMAREMRDRPWVEAIRGVWARYLQMMDERLPNFGCLATNCDYVTGFEDADACVTFGRIGGKGAFTGKYSSGTTTAVALVVNGQVLAAYVADIISDDVIGFGPVTSQVQHWRQFGFDLDGDRLKGEPLPENLLPLNRQTVSLRQEREQHSEGLAAIARSCGSGGLFRRYESVALGVDPLCTMMSLVRGNTGALVLPANGNWVPWIDAPMIGLAQACNMSWLQADASGKLREIDPYPFEQGARTDEVVIVHRRHAAELMSAYVE